MFNFLQVVKIKAKEFFESKYYKYFHDETPEWNALLREKQKAFLQTFPDFPQKNKIRKNEPIELITWYLYNQSNPREILIDDWFCKIYYTDVVGRGTVIEKEEYRLMNPVCSVDDYETKAQRTERFRKYFVLQ